MPTPRRLPLAAPAVALLAAVAALAPSPGFAEAQAGATPPSIRCYASHCDVLRPVQRRLAGSPTAKDAGARLVPDGARGLLLAEVREGGVAHQLGLRAGDHLITLDLVRIVDGKSAADARAIAARADRFILGWERGGARHALEIAVRDALPAAPPH